MKKVPPIGQPLARRQNLPEELAEVIMRRIESGEFLPGDVLPSEQSLADTFKVSRTVVREALARLKYEGIIESKRGSGPIVKSAVMSRGYDLNVDDLTRDELREFLEFRIIMEGEAAALAAHRRTPEQVEQLRIYLNAMAQAIENKTSGTEPDYLFHRLIADSATNSYLGEFVKFISTKMWLGVFHARWRSNQVLEQAEAVYKEHKATFDAIESGDPVEARMAAQHHLLNSALRQGLTIDKAFLTRTP